jgi:CheY-like chemotaxis protein
MTLKDSLTATASHQGAFCNIPEIPDKSDFSAHDYCILVVDDCRINQMITMRTLTRLGYPAYVVADGQQALDALKQYPYALVLMDCQMPVMDGYQAAREIRKREAPGQHIPIVAYSTCVSASEQTLCLLAGMDTIIEKPSSPEYLEAVLQQLLETSRIAIS